MENISNFWETTLSVKHRLTATLILSFFVIFQLQASLNTQYSNVSLNYSKVPVLEVISKIESITDSKFLYNRKDVNPNYLVNIKTQNASIDKVLELLFDDSNIEFKVYNKQIILKKNGVELASISKLTTKVVNLKKELIDVSNNIKSVLQDQIVTGTITDEKGDPVPGVAVFEKGNEQNATSTDEKGKFELKVDSLDITLVISHMSYNSIEIDVDGKSEINIVLEFDSSSLDEIVIVGYGSKSRRTLTSSVSTIKTTEIEELPYQNMGDAVSGRIPGLIVNGGNTTPGSTPTISIRGGSTPLVVIDDIIEEDINQFYSMNPRDIESISFLKDGAATAIYGSRASNGVILVTTKTGYNGKLRINYGGSASFTNPAISRERVGSYEWAKAQNDATFYQTGESNKPYTEEVLNKYRDQSDPVNFPNTNWDEQVYKDIASQNQHHISFRGGSSRFGHYLALGYLNQGSLYKSEVGKLNRYNLVTNVTSNFKAIGLKTTFRLNATKYDIERTALSEWAISSYVKNATPISLAKNPDGTYASTSRSPLSSTDKGSGYDRNNYGYIRGQLMLEWKVPKVKGLSVKLMGNYSTVLHQHKLWNSPVKRYDLDGNVVNPNDTPDLKKEITFSDNLVAQVHLNYDRTFDKHEVSVTQLFTQNVENDNGLSGSKEKYPLRSADVLSVGPTNGQTVSGSYSESTRRAYVGRISYSYDKKYLFEYSYRYDGTDNFLPEKRWGLFPSYSLGWVTSEEKFWNASNFFSLLKVRYSYGTVGNDGTIGTGEFGTIPRYDYIKKYTLRDNVLLVDGTLQPGLVEGSFPNQGLTWFSTIKSNFGVDFEVWEKRFAGSIDYFYNRTTGFTESPRNVYSTPLGIELPKINSDNAFRRHGIEFSLTYNGKVGDFRYKVNGNMVWNERLWEKYNETEVQLKNPRTRVTHRKNTHSLALVADDLYENYNEIVNSPLRTSSADLKPGDIRYIDINGDGKIDDQDKIQQGKSRFPSVSYGLNFDIYYKAWSLSTLISGASNMSRMLGFSSINFSSKTVTYKYQLDYWTPKNTNSSLPRLLPDHTNNGSNNIQPSSYWLKDGTYIRIKSLQLSYDMKKGILQHIEYIDKLLITFSATNLLTWSELNKYMDPENSSSWGYNYPVIRAFSFGLNTTL